MSVSKNGLKKKSIQKILLIGGGRFFILFRPSDNRWSNCGRSAGWSALDHRAHRRSLRHQSLQRSPDLWGSDDERNRASCSNFRKAKPRKAKAPAAALETADFSFLRDSADAC